MTAPSREELRRAIVAGLRQAATAAFILAVPVFLLTTNVRLAFDSLALYRFGFEQYDVTTTTGLSMDQLMEVATEVRDYFNSSDELLDVQVDLAGEVRPLFNEREILHMRDVKGLVRGIYALQSLSGVYLLGYAAVVLAAGRWRGAQGDSEAAGAGVHFRRCAARRGAGWRRWWASISYSTGSMSSASPAAVGHSTQDTTT